MRQPAHDDFVFANRLLAIDGDVLPAVVRMAGDDQSPGNQRGDVLRPALLNGQAFEIDVFFFQHVGLAGRGGEQMRGHVPDVFGQRDFAQRLSQILRWFGLFKPGKTLADGAQFAGIFRAQRQGNPFGGAEKIGEQGVIVKAAVSALRPGEEQGGAALGEHATRDFRYFQMRGDGMMDALEFAARFQQGDKLAQVGAGFHGLP